jgi:hypothetical protein
MRADPLVDLLGELYRRQVEQLPHEEYLRQHAAREFVEGTVRVFRFYEPWLPRTGTLLDWGCRHAPDACLIRAELGTGIAIEGCDVFPEAHYGAFHEYSGLRYHALRDTRARGFGSCCCTADSGRS